MINKINNFLITRNTKSKINKKSKFCVSKKKSKKKYIPYWKKPINVYQYNTIKNERSINELKYTKKWLMSTISSGKQLHYTNILFLLKIKQYLKYKLLNNLININIKISELAFYYKINILFAFYMHKDKVKHSLTLNKINYVYYEYTYNKILNKRYKIKLLQTFYLNNI